MVIFVFNCFLELFPLLPSYVLHLSLAFVLNFLVQFNSAIDQFFLKIFDLSVNIWHFFLLIGERCCKNYSFNTLKLILGGSIQSLVHLRVPSYDINSSFQNISDYKKHHYNIYSVKSYKSYIKMYLLFSFEFLDIKLTAPNENSIILQQKAQNLCKIIDNGIPIRNFIKMINKLDIQVISYSAKNKKHCADIYNAIDPSILEKWIFINQDNKKYQEIMPNRAFLSENCICFGQYYSSNGLKNGIRLAIHCALKQFNRGKFIILQKNPQELQILKKQKDRYLQILNHVNIQMQELQQLINQSKQSTIPDLKFPQYQPHNLDTLFPKNISDIITKLFQPKQSFSIALVGRTPKSKSICNLIFVNSLDKHPYLLKTDKIRQVGGQLYSQQLENIEFASQLSTFLRINMLRHWKGFSLTSKSLLGIYDRKKANHIIKPYVEKLCTLSENIKDRQSIEELLKNGKLGKKNVKGLGKMIVLGLLCGENFKIKSFIEQLSFIDNEQDTLQCIKFDCNQIFKEIYLDTDSMLTLRISELLPQYKINDLSQQYHAEIREILLEVAQNSSIIQGVFNHYKWQFPKFQLYSNFQKRHELLMEIFKCDHTKGKQLIKQKDQIPPIQYRLLIGTDFSYFYQLPDEYQIQYRKQNIYLQLIRNDPSFQIHTNTPKLNLLLSYLSARYQVNYMSFLTSTKEQYVILMKKIKMKYENQKKANIIVLDHAQLYEDVGNINRAIKTIFISRLKKIECSQLEIIDEQYILKQNLMESSQELFQVLVRDQQLSYQLYQKTIFTWIFDKADFYKIPRQSCLKFLQELVSRITSSKNRFSQFSHLKQIYCLPVGKYKQRIYLHHDIYQFLHAKFLIEKILDKCWSGQLEPNQLEHFQKWINLYPKKQRVIENLWDLAGQINDREKRSDVLQMLLFMGQKNNMTLSDYFQFNYSSIELVVSLSEEKYIVCSRKNIYEYDWDPTNKAQCNNFHERCVGVLQNYDRRLLLIATNVENDPEIMMLKSIEISKEKTIIENQKLKPVLIQKNTNKEICFLNETTILGFSKHISTLQMLSPQQKILFTWEYPVKSLVRFSDCQILVNQGNKISIFDIIQQKSSVIFKHDGNIESIQLYQQKQGSFILVAIREPNIIAILSKNGQLMGKIDLQKPISCSVLDLQTGLLYYCQQNDDTMQIYKMFQTQQQLKFKFIKKYYQIVLNPKQIISKNKAVLLIGQGFIKKYNITQLFKNLEFDQL